MTPSLNCMAARARIPAAPAPLTLAGLLAMVVVMAGICSNAQAQFLAENVDWVESEAPASVDLPIEGAAALKAAVITVVLHYTTTGPLA